MTRHLRPVELDAYIDGSAAPSETKRIEDHIAACVTCRAAYDSASSTVRAINALPKTASPGEDLWADIHEQLRPRKQRGWQRGWLERISASLAKQRIPAFAFSVAILLILASVVRDGEFGRTGQADAEMNARVSRLLRLPTVWGRLDGALLAAQLNYATDETITELLLLLKLESNGNVRISVVAALRRHADHPLLRRDFGDSILDESSAVVQMEILHEIVALDPPGAAQTLREKLKDNSLRPAVREAIELAILELER